MGKSKSQKIEALMEEMGMLPPELWEAKAIVHNMEDLGPTLGHQWHPTTRVDLARRRTGRTTQILLGGLVEALQGKTVFIVAHDESWECKMADQLREWVVRFEGDPELVWPMRVARKKGDRQNGKSKVIVDHWTGIGV